jgi:hypothetical protein
MHYIDFERVSTKSRKGRLLGVLTVFIFALIFIIIMMNVLSSQSASMDANLWHLLTA